MAAQMGGSISSHGRQMAQELFNSCSEDIRRFNELGGMQSIAVLEEELPMKICGYVGRNKEYVSAETGLRYVIEKVECVKGIFTVRYRGRCGAHKGVLFHSSLIDFLSIRKDGSPSFSLLPGED